MQAFGGGSPELRPLATARRGRPASLSDDDPPREDEPFVVPLEDALDLHAFAPRDVASVVEEYLTAAAAHGFRDVRLIHGRGIGVQRVIVRGVLSRHPAVESFAAAPPEAGGWGATLVRLRISNPAP
ncbi:MAG TPA: Smr/MutS family protein [Candidatus Limnocylindria bacterium]|nr:Smr/MutS family protein [Candidatus Limnocylindria bacterium]